MHPAYKRLQNRVRPLGNPAQKQLRAVEQHGELLVERLEAIGAASHVHLDRVAPAVAEDFERVAAASTNPEEKLVLLGTFYAVQLLHQNARSLEQLAYSLAEKSERRRAFSTFVARSEDEFFTLASTYVNHVLRVVAPEQAGRYAILAVGTRGHQDDLDIAVLLGFDADRAAVDRGVARLAGQCLRFASPLDNYIAGELGAPGFAVTLEQLDSALRTGRMGFVVVTELLRAELLAGDDELLRRLRREVTADYLHQPGRDNTRHERYLRGLLGETRSLLLRPPRRDRINPKEEGLRLIVGLASALRAVERLDATQPREILAEMASTRPRWSAQLLRLEESRVFLETLRQTAQLLVAEEEDIAVESEAAQENLARVAAAMGYVDWGPVGAIERLLVNNFESVEAARGAALAVMNLVADHLTGISRFAAWRRQGPPANLALELGEALVANTRTFRAIRFYDDLLDAFAAPDQLLLNAFLRSYAQLSPNAREQLGRMYAEWGCDAPYTFLTITTLVAAASPPPGGGDPAREVTSAYIARLPGDPEAVRALCRVFRFYPELTNRFLLTLNESLLDRLDAAIDAPIGDPEVAEARDRLRALIHAQRHSSRYVKRVLARVTVRHPAIAAAISDDATLVTLALGRAAESERRPDAEEQKSLLGDSYDIEFLRIAMGALRGEHVRRTRAAFAELTVLYLDRLFDLCFREVDRSRPGAAPQRDRIGVFLSGGNTRRRPFDEDYDLLALIDSTKPEDQSFAERVVTLMNRQIARRGVIPQHRLSDHFGRYVIMLDELAELLAGDADDLFVERCQLLGARMVAGGRRVEQELENRVLRPLVFADAERFAARVGQEIADRRRGFRPPPEGRLELKRHPGGFREIDLALAVVKARLGDWNPVGSDPFVVFAQTDPGRAEIHRGLSAVNEFLVALRTAYRVAVAATDEIEAAHLGAPARILGRTEGHLDPGAGRRLFAETKTKLAEAARLVDRVIDPATWR